MPTTKQDVAHLLRRAGFGATGAEVDELAQLERSAIVDTLVDPIGKPWPSFPAQGAAVGLDNISSDWWLSHMATTKTPLIEKMALFWHGHFTSSVTKASMEAMWNQNQLFRTQGLGSFEQLAQDVSIDPAMLGYLDTKQNIKTGRNENFARELLELFLLGVDKYSQDDVVAASKAWTGHGVNQDTGKYEFRPYLHDDSVKTFLGVSKNWNGPDIIAFLCNDAKWNKVVAQHIVNKMWTFFAHPNPPENVTKALTDVFLKSKLDIRTLVRALFNRPEFYTDATKQGHVRSPAEFLVAVIRYTGFTPKELTVNDFTDLMGQQLFAPPSVKGWNGDDSWISSTAIWAKGNFAKTVAKLENSRSLLSGTASATVANAVQTSFDAFGIDRVSASTRKTIETAVAADRRNGSKNERTTLIVMTLLSPDFQVA